MGSGNAVHSCCDRIGIENEQGKEIRKKLYRINLPQRGTFFISYSTWVKVGCLEIWSEKEQLLKNTLIGIGGQGKNCHNLKSPK